MIMGNYTPTNWVTPLPQKGIKILLDTCNLLRLNHKEIKKSEQINNE